MAEYLTRALLDQRVTAGGGPTVASAGTHAVPGRPMHPYAARLLAEQGADPAAFRSRPVTRTELTSAGLVLTASRRHRASCVALAPAAVNRTFTLRQFSRLVTALATTRRPAAAGTTHTARGGTRPMPVPALVDAALRVRGTLQPVAAEADDLADPIGRPWPDFQACAREIATALATIVPLIAEPG